MGVIVAAGRLGAGAVEAVAIGFGVGWAISFVLQKLVTFRDRRFERRVLTFQTLVYAGLIGVNFGFTLLVTALLSPPLPAPVARTVALAVTTIWNFLVYRRHVFGDGRRSQPAF